MVPGQFMNDDEKKLLLTIARDSIVHGLAHGRPLIPGSSALQGELGENKASFVTLDVHGHLRGCIGMLEAIRPLAEDVAKNAYAAAFRDPRFMPVTKNEVTDLSIHISILSKPEPMNFFSEKDLLRQIRPGIDGLILSDGQRKGTFLPSVWETLPEAADFLRELKKKAGLDPDYWSPTIKVERYTCESIGE